VDHAAQLNASTIMSTINPIWLEGRRRYWQRHDWQRFIRHDAHRFLTPAGIAEEKRAAEAEQAAQREVEETDAAEREAFYAEHLELRRQLADVKFELAFRRIFRKYNPDQPRDDRGRWVDDPDKGRADDTGKETGDKPADITDVSAGRIRLAGDPPAPLQLIHPDTTYEHDPRAKRSLDFWRSKPTNDTVESLKPGTKEPLKAYPDGRVRDGNTRVRVLHERGYDVNSLPRVILPSEPMTPLRSRGGSGGGLLPQQ
jgi:hypothetical protein